MLGNGHVKITIPEQELSGSIGKDIVFYGVYGFEKIETEEKLERQWKKTEYVWAYQGPGGKKPHDDEPGKDDHQTPPSINYYNPFKHELGFEKKVKAAEENDDLDYYWEGVVMVMREVMSMT